MAEEMRRDERVFLMGEEVAQYQGAYKVSQGLLEEFGDKRVVDTPITEHGFAGVGVGAAYRGLRPIVEFMTFNFAMQAIDHLINSAAKTLYMTGGAMPVPIVFRGPNGAAARVAAQHSQNFAAWYASVPGLKVVAPYSAADAKGLLNAALEDPNPYLYFEHKLLYRSISGPVPDNYYTVEIGKAALAATGTQVSIITYGMGVHWATKVVEELGISADILDLRTLLPWDKEAVAATVKKTGKVIFLQEDTLTGGIGAEICAWISEHCFASLDAPVMREGSLDTPVPFAPNLEKQFLPVDRFKVKLQGLIAF